MRIEASERVVYKHNPLAEVVCQIQFKKLDDLSENEKAALQAKLASTGYPIFGEEIALGFPVQSVVGDQSAPASVPVVLSQARIHHFSSEDAVWRVSISSDFVALVCTKYSGWDEFLPRMLAAASLLETISSNIQPTRLGLRYKDVIEREPLGLENVPWHELIQPFLLGPLAPNALAEGHTPTDAHALNFMAQTQLSLEHSMLLLQSSLLTSLDGQQRAFLIDADFYNEVSLEPTLITSPSVLKSRLDVLHASAGALFRRAITKRLHDALRPSI